MIDIRDAIDDLNHNIDFTQSADGEQFVATPGEIAILLATLQSENAEKDKEIVKLKLEKELIRQEWVTLQADLSRMEAERDTLRDSVADFIVENADCLKIAIDTQDRHYLEVLIAQWRGAQGEG
ncbi:hypothetical protein GMD88_18580 [Pseudoflavonifractor sp. BIOML-A6]|nr:MULTISPECIES: hypothetical protein [unclassified Pseudoflavonifractor]KAB4839547.1 hypothetical protein GAG88_26330 [Bacteroides thetaiotaomicron]MTQ98844.1 hypothetical protein [Pseudoflavonifractor sp. BIOML-A16]MTR08073.1 hypothetical protein [Pseudoflavonifractor sp. BIOML-A15]MTR34347.1 hypothetical protein [Pseudoflavonifractor sp. BIOML-A14]MTR75076.1 hypothetical protein [Pseudoflavonifractor sp. BIOML-A18]MTS73589.1 hypothetical protein [Pseudoflavonifractor sp. BIOML-A8]MTS93073